ncbi:hypothetical protein Tco_0737226 [Tanacetum coccineum]
MMEKLVIRENRQRVLVSKRIERVGENKNRKRAVWNKNRQSDLVSKRIERICELKNRKRVEYIKNRQSVWTGIGVNAGNSKLMLLGINLILLATVKAKTVNEEVQLQALVDGKKIIIIESTVRRDLQLEDAEGADCLPNATIFEQLALMGYDQKQKPRKPKRKDTQIPQSSGPTKHVADEAVYKELDDSLVRATTTASSLEAEQDSGNIIKTRSKATPNEAGSQRTTSGGSPRRQETMGDTIAQTRLENVSKLFNDPLLARVLDLEKTKTTQAEEIVSLKRRVKKLEQKKRSRTHRLKRLYKVGLTARVESSGDEESLGEDASKQGKINAIDADEDITLVNDQDDADMFDVNTLTSDEVLAEQEVAAKDVNLTVDEVTLAQALAALKSVKPKVKANVVEELSVPVSADSTKVSAATITTTAIIPTPRKGIVITEVEEPVKKLSKKKYLIRFDEEIALKLQAEFDEEERLTREKDEANVALTKEWDDIQAKVDADYQLAQRLQAKEQEQFITKQKATFSKRAGDELEQEVTKHQKVDDFLEIAEVDDDQEAAKIKDLMKIVPDEEEVAIDAILATSRNHCCLEDT